MQSIVNTGELTDEEYSDAMEVEDAIVWPLHSALHHLYDVRSYLDVLSLDNEKQKAYIRRQLDELSDVLKVIEDKLEG